MSGEETAFLNILRAHLADEVTRLVYADWLDERGDPRGSFLRLRHELLKVGPDHVQRFAAECELSKLRKGLEPEWLTVVEPERAHLFRPHSDREGPRAACHCFAPCYDSSRKWTPLSLHIEPQDTECEPWLRLCDEVEAAIRDQQESFRPLGCLRPEEWRFIVTLPPRIAELKVTKVLLLYGSSLVRLPAEIGAMTNLADFDPYTSYRLHWYPYEIAHCQNLRDSRMSTRALYGNFKYYPPFPALVRDEPQFIDWPTFPRDTTRPCSVCRKPFEDRREHRSWITLRLGTDNMPLLVNACSRECVESLPAPVTGAFPKPHRGGLGTPRRF